MRSHWLLALSLSASALAQQPTTESPAKQPTHTEVSADKPMPPEALVKAEEAKRPELLAAFVDAKVATQAVFSGQYAELAQLGWDARPLLCGWLNKAPGGIKAERVSFQVACINALRDCVDKPSDELLADLQKLATGAGVPEQVALNAKFALSQFGKPELVDQMLQAALKDTSDTDIGKRVGSWNQLAEIYYNTRRYADAAKAYGQAIRAIESVRPDFPGLPGSYYNCACSYALSGDKEQALKQLTKAIELGKKVRQPIARTMVESDMDLRSLRGTPEFEKLMKEHFGTGEKAVEQTDAPK